MKDISKIDKPAFTFIDWENEKIPTITQEDWVKKGEYQYGFLKATNADLHEYWKMALVINDETFQQIDEAKKEVFLIGAENTAEGRFRQLKQHLNSIPQDNINAFIEEQKTQCNKKIKGSKEYQEVLSGKIDKDLVTPILYRVFLKEQARLEADDKYISDWPTIKKETETTVEWIDIDNPLFVAHVYSKYLEKLKQFNKEGNTQNGRPEDFPKADTKDEDNRGIHMKGKEIIPEQDFWDEAKETYQKLGDKYLTSEGNPNGRMIKRLAGKTSELEFYGYERRDENKKNPKRLNRSKVRRLLVKYPKKWKHNK